ncbi:MAG TPA: hypothetical protein VJ463_09340 [Geothrix sp.]|nr:hypothetical protein [Geothrix sp.]
MHALECVKCAAPLPTGPEDVPITCPYCGTVNEPTVAKPTPLQAMLQQEEIKHEAVQEAKAELKMEWTAAMAGQRLAGAGPAAPARRIVVRGCGRSCGCCLGPALVGGILVAALVANAPSWDRLRNVREILHLAGVKLKPEDLATFHDQQRVVLDLAPPAKLDPGAGTAWALDLARRWAPDARLTGVRAVRVRRDGTVDPADARAETTFVFESAAKVQESLAKEARSSAEVIHGLTLRVAQGRVEARLAFGPNNKGSASASTLPLAQLLEHARTTGRLPDQPVYQASLYLEGATPIWRVEALAPPASVYLRATDGRILR